MSKLTFGFISKTDPFTDRRAWSGTTYKVRESIEQAGYAVKWIPYRTPVVSKFILGLSKLYTLVTKKEIVHSHIPAIARLEAGTVDKRMFDECDMLFFCGESQILAFLETAKPVCYLSDATFERMVDYYWPNLATRSIGYGNAIEQRALDKASVVIHSSDWARNSARDFYHTSASKLHVVEFGANIDEQKIREKERSEAIRGGGGEMPQHIVFRCGLGTQRRGACSRNGRTT